MTASATPEIKVKKMSGPTLPISQEIHATKYRGPNEGFREAMNRIANALKDDEGHFRAFREILLDMRFAPGGRVQSAMGATKNVTPYNCFVSGTIEDSFVEGHGSIMARAQEAAATMRQGGGIGYDFSTLRPRGDLIKKLSSASSGPLSFMEVYDAVCRCVASSGHRRGAQMGVLRIDHPDIEAYIHAKQPRPEHAALWQHVQDLPAGEERAGLIRALQTTLPLQGFNLSIAVTDEFMECLEAGKPFALKFGGRTYSEVDPVALWDAVMRGTWDWAEPGVLFIDTINKMNNLWYCEQIAATNPCGEQPLPPYGACLLGSFNLTRYLVPKSSAVLVGQPRWDFDWDMLAGDIPFVVRAMDNVVDRAKFPLYEQEKEAKSKRRMGLGVMGLANALEALGMPYGTPEFLKFEDRLMAFINRHCYLASVEIAKVKGAFPMFDKEKFLQGGFIRTLDQSVLEGIRQHGIRNSHLTSVAPTGTISLSCDNISSGIEPVFLHQYDRTIQTFDGPRVETVSDYGARVFGVKGRTANEVTPEEHVAVLTTATKHVDSAVSKTCNVGGDTDWEAFKRLYVAAYAGGAKGCTTFRTDGKRAGVLVAKQEPEDDKPAEACYIDPATGRRECS